MPGKKVLVVGASREGIGQAVTDELLAREYDVVGLFASDEVENSAEYRTNRPAVEWREIDTHDPVKAMATLKSISGVTAAVHADFYFYMEAAHDFSLDKWHRSLTANLTIPKLLGHVTATEWKETCKSVVFVTSSEASTGSFGAHAYSATKAAVHNLVKSLANVSGPRVRFNAVAAGWIGGVMDTDEVFNMSREVTPLGRLGSAEEVGRAVNWLLSSDSSFVNGSVLVVDGGYTGVDTISKFEYEAEQY